MTELEQYRPAPLEPVRAPLHGLALPDGAAAIQQWAMTLEHATTLANALVQTPFVPASYRPKIDPRADIALRREAHEIAVATTAAAIMFGAGLGFDPLAALQNVYVVSGRPSLYAEAMVALVVSAGHRLWVEDLTDTRAVVCGARRGSEHTERVIVNMDQAKRAGWTRNEKYRTEPQAMLYARAASRVCRTIAPDVLRGVSASVEEMQDGQPDAPAEVLHVVRRSELPTAEDSPNPAPAADPAPAGKSRRRSTKAPAAEPQRTTEAADVAPPLPGEDGYDDESSAPSAAEKPHGNDEPTCATRQQIEAIQAGLAEQGITDKGLIKAWIYDVVQREFTNAYGLTEAEAQAVLDKLAEPAFAPDDQQSTLDGES